MANPHHASVLAQFEGRIHNTKNRLVAVPASVQRELGLIRRRDNHIVAISIRPKARGRWNHHYVKLTFDNEFAIPSDVERFAPGDDVEVKIHRIIADEPVEVPRAAPGGASLLAALAAPDRPAWRTDGAERLDEYLAADE